MSLPTRRHDMRMSLLLLPGKQWHSSENGRFRIGWTTVSGEMGFRCRVWYLAQTFEKYRIVAVMILASIGDGGPDDS